MSDPQEGADPSGDGGKTLAEKLASKRASDDAAARAVAPQQAAEPAAAPVISEHDAIVEAAKRARAGVGKPARARQLTCLVVDDSRVVRKIAGSIAGSLGYNVVHAENGEEALARCKSAMPDLVLTDWQMPVMSGIEFVQTLRALPGGGAAKVVFCTSKSDTKDIHDGIAAGADDYVLKPFDEPTLKAKLAKMRG